MRNWTSAWPCFSLTSNNDDDNGNVDGDGDDDDKGDGGENLINFSTFPRFLFLLLLLPLLFDDAAEGPLQFKVVDFMKHSMGVSDDLFAASDAAATTSLFSSYIL